MPIEMPPYRRYLLAGGLVVLLVGLVLLFGEPLAASARRLYDLLLDREQTRAFVEGFGPWAPVVFMAVQIGQVLLAPIPGEATGFIGGYLFGAAPGFFYSSLALGVGSWINFGLGRLLGRKLIRRLIPAAQLAKLDRHVRPQAVLVIFLLFVFPGFPKDYLCLFLGITTLSPKLFLMMAFVGRMPGTLMLSLQGAALFERMYGVLAVLLGGCVLLLLVAYRYRERLYRWIEAIDRHNSSSR
ncbi:MAG: VTT domain-containing protein [Desulfobacterales bacterium]|nr:VTT domain-containing protein [Desulfobacterales bacterium]